MLDLRRMESIRLRSKPNMQRFVALALLMPNYNLPPRVRIEVEGAENLPDEPVIFAMNHTDRYNYWPFQYWLWRNRKRFTATWVKGKYYENAFMSFFMAVTNNIPTPSRGYVLAKDFKLTMGRAPEQAEYEAIRDLCTGASSDTSAIPQELLESARSILGRDFDPAKESYASAVNGVLKAMNQRFIELNTECFDRGLDLLIFPQGTRSVRLSRGRIGVAQAASHFHKTVVPIGCSGSDKAYPGGSPWARGATIVYRIGKPRRYAEATGLHLPAGVDAFAEDLAEDHRNALMSEVDALMQDINQLVDPEYQFAQDQASDGVEGARRFI
jgi:1-acyl-sn-glycerol-3-phosphate acyltransferase